MRLLNRLKQSEFSKYFIISGAATVIDWSIFWFFNSKLLMHYQICLMAGYFTGGLFHFTANKMVTFNCQSKKIGSQFSLYMVVNSSSLVLSMGVMALIVYYFAIDKLYARMLTTFLILYPNYLLHKFITFNKKIFLQPGIN